MERSTTSSVEARGDGRRAPDQPCRNCSDPSFGNYCPTCGQRKGDVRVSLRRLVLEIIDDQLSINSALPRTLVALLFRPGLLTDEFMRGRIVRYVQPFRLYLVMSVAFFLLLTLLGSRAFGDADFRLQVSGGRQQALQELEAELRKEGVEGKALADAMAGVPVGQAPDRGENWADRLGIDTGIPALDRRIEHKLVDLAGMEPVDAARTLTNDFLERAPVMMFVLLPVFALLLKLFYVRRRRYYVEHFVFALHLHAFLFFAFTVMVVLQHPLVVFVVWTAASVYGFVAMRRVYGQGFGKTLVKYMLLSWAYFFVLAFAFVVTLLAALALS